MDQARVLIVGCGGIGTMAALNLETGGRARVSAVLRSNYAAVEKSGFTIQSVDHGEVQGFRPSESKLSYHTSFDYHFLIMPLVLPAVPDVSAQNITPFDYVVCTTKNVPDVGYTPLADLLRPAITPGHTAVILIQNGLNIELPLLKAFPDNIVLSGISMCGSEEREPGVIIHKLPDDLGVGPFRDVGDAADRARDFVARYTAGGRCTAWYDTNVPFSRWRKLLLNASVNPTCAILDMDSGDMQLSPGLVDQIVRPAMKEIKATAKAYGHELTDEMIEAMITSDPVDSHILPSMLVDVRKVL